MRIRRLALAAVAALAALPMSGAMAASTTTNLREALADPLESSFIEQTFPNSSVIVGYFDAGGFSNWAGTTADQRSYIRNELTSNGFVTGYQRYWYMKSSNDQLFEEVFVFGDSTGASSMLSQERSDRSNSNVFKGWVPLQLNGTAFALNESDASDKNYYWTDAGFTKGNDSFILFRGSDSGFQANAATAQATRMYSVAPNGTRIGSQQATTRVSAVTQFRTPLIITFVTGALLIGVALVIAVVATVMGRPQQQAVQRP